MFSGNELITSQNPVKWYRKNYDLLDNSCGFIFEINFRAENHPVYQSISLNLYRTKGGTQLILAFNFHENSIIDPDAFSSLVNDIKKYKFKMALSKYLSNSPKTFEIAKTDAYRNAPLLKIFELFDQCCPLQLSRESFRQGVNDMLFNVILHKDLDMDKDRDMARGMQEGLIEPDLGNDASPVFIPPRI